MLKTSLTQQHSIDNKTYLRCWPWVAVDCNKFPVFSSTYINNKSMEKIS